MSGCFNIVIVYGSQFQVTGPVVSAPVVHAMRTDNPVFTLCRKRPYRYEVTDHSGASTTCPACLAALAGEPIQHPTPKPVKVRRKRTARPKSVEEVKQAYRRHRHQQDLLDDAEVKRQRDETKGLSRSWYLTPKGKALVEKWEE